MIPEQIKIPVNEYPDGLSARWFNPEDAYAQVLMTHGAGAPMEHPFMSTSARLMVERGLAVLQYNFMYMQLGSKRPDRPKTTVSSIREIYAAKGFTGELLEQVVEVITSDEEVWVDTMMKEELEMTRDRRAPVKTAAATFISFNVIGFIPLLAYVIALWIEIPDNSLFWISSAATGLALIIIGNLKSYVTERSRIRGILETLLLGGLAAILAYYVGVILSAMIL